MKTFFSVMLLLLGLQGISQQEKLVLPLPEAGTAPGMQRVANTLANGVEKPGIATSYELIDNTGDSLTLGYINTSNSNNDRIALTAPVSKIDWLAAIAGEKLANAFTARGTKGLYILNDISIGRTGTGNYIRLKAHVYESLPIGNTYHMVNNIDTFVTDNNVDIKNISNAVSNIVSRSLFLGKAIITAPTGKGLTKDEITKSEKDKCAFISNSQFPTGIYMSFDEFKKTTPAFSQFFIKVDEKTNTVQVNAFTETDSTLRPVIPWGIAVNNEVYFYRNNKLYPLEASGNNLVLSKYIDPQTRKNSAQFWRMTVGERLNEKYKNPFDNVNELRVTNYKNKGIAGEAIKINADTGEPEL